MDGYDEIALTDLREQLGKVVTGVGENGKPTIVTKAGKVVAVIMNPGVLATWALPSKYFDEDARQALLAELGEQLRINYEAAEVDAMRARISSGLGEAGNAA